MASTETYKYELEGRLADLADPKMHLSVRYEPGPGIVRVGVCLSEYTWEKREQAIDRLLQFEADHADEIAVEFDIIPVEAVNTVGFAEV